MRRARRCILVLILITRRKLAARAFNFARELFSNYQSRDRGLVCTRRRGVIDRGVARREAFFDQGNKVKPSKLVIAHRYSERATDIGVGVPNADLAGGCTRPRNARRDFTFFLVCESIREFARQ